MQSLHDELELIGFQRACAAQRGEHVQAEVLRQRMTYILDHLQSRREAMHRATQGEGQRQT